MCWEPFSGINMSPKWRVIFLTNLNSIYNVVFFFFFFSLFYRANEQSALHDTLFGKGNVIVTFDPGWYFIVYSGKIESSGLLYESLWCLQGACMSS